MSIPLTINGVTFQYPVDFDEDWGVDATGWAQAVTNGTLQMAGGSFPLTSNVNFGPNFGLLSQYFQTRSASPATTGTVRLSSADAGVAFRNNANNGNLILTTDASDNLLFNGSTVSGGVNAGTQFQLGYYATTGSSISGLTLITANRALASNANGLPVASATTATELGYVNGVTSAIQTQINTKANDSAVVHNTGIETVAGAKTFTSTITSAISGSNFLNHITLNHVDQGQKSYLVQNSTGPTVDNFYISANEDPTNSIFNKTGQGSALINIRSVTASSGTNEVDIYVSNVANTPATLAATFKDTGCTIKGTTTNDDAATGFVGEYVSATTVGTTNFPASATFGDATSIVLTAGDWDITVSGRADQSTATWSAMQVGASTSPGNSATGLVHGVNRMGGNWANSASTPVTFYPVVAAYRVQPTTTTTYYLKVFATYSAGQPSYDAMRISARRMR